MKRSYSPSELDAGLYADNTFCKKFKNGKPVEEFDAYKYMVNALRRMKYKELRNKLFNKIVGR